MEDTGARREFETGAVRDRGAGKGRPELICALFLIRLSMVMEEGAIKYGDRNWEKGMPLHDVMGSLLRHALAWMLGKTDEDHLGHLAANIMFLINFEERIKKGVLPKSLATQGPLVALSQKMVLVEVPINGPEDLIRLQESGKKNAPGVGL